MLPESESVQAILKDRFYHKGEISWADVANRVTDYWMWDAAPNERQGVREMLMHKDALPNTPALANAGRRMATGSACFVLPIEDSLDSIMGTLKDAALVHKSGGGTGFSFNRIRRKGAMVSTTGREAPGPANMLKLYSSAIAHVTQAGMRPGANMGIINVDHPDLFDFIDTKAHEGDIHNFNISVGFTDSFMRDAMNGEWSADRFLDKITLAAWRNGEPGAFFIDTTNRQALHPEPIEATNPCGEVPLRPYEACVLGSINLARHITGDGGVDWDKLRSTCFRLVHLLDNVIEYQHYPLARIEEEQKRYRKIGVGIMGLADMLAEIGVPYGSSPAANATEIVMRAVQNYTYEASEYLMEKHGPYSGWYANRDLPYRRNLNCQVVAPTGTISRLAECSFGIEPHFDVDGYGYYQSFIVGGQFMDHIPYHTSPVFTPASKVTLNQHLTMQAAVQKHTDQAVSKTINCPHYTTHAEIKDAYLRAWALGLKGLTILREGSRENVVIGNTTHEDEPPAAGGSGGVDDSCRSGVCPM